MYSCCPLQRHLTSKLTKVLAMEADAASALATPGAVFVDIREPFEVNFVIFSACCGWLPSSFHPLARRWCDDGKDDVDMLPVPSPLQPRVIPFSFLCLQLLLFTAFQCFSLLQLTKGGGLGDKVTHIPMGELITNAYWRGAEEPYASFKSAPGLFLICATGARAVGAADMLRASGFEACQAIAGGVPAWTAATNGTTSSVLGESTGSSTAAKSDGDAK